MGGQDVDAVLQKILGDEIDAMTHLAKCRGGVNAMFIAVLADDKGNMHYQFTSTATTTLETLNLVLGVHDAVATCVRSTPYRDANNVS